MSPRLIFVPARVAFTKKLIAHSPRGARPIATCLLALVTVFTAPAAFAALFEYAASAPEAVRGPTDQGWLAVEITAVGTDSNSDGLIDGSDNHGPIQLPDGSFAWQVRDQNTEASADLPYFRISLSEPNLVELFKDGWTLNAELSVPDVSPDGYSGFFGWGFSGGLGGWQVPGGIARIGFSPGILNPADAPDQQRFRLLVYGHGDIVLAPGSAGQVHAIKAVGIPQSTGYELFVNGVSYGYFDAADSRLGGQTANLLVFGARSSAPTGGTINWISLSLASGGPVEDYQYRLAREYDTRPDSLMGNGIDLATGSFTQAIDVLTTTGLRAFSFTATYDSQLTFSPGPLGYGWSHGYEARLVEIDEDFIEVQWDANRSNRFRRDRALDTGSRRIFLPVETDLRQSILRRFADFSILVLPDESVLEFDSADRLRSLLNAASDPIEIARDAAGRVSRISETGSDTAIILDYNNEGRVSEVSDTAGRRVPLSYDEHGRLVRLPSPVDDAFEPALSSVPATVPAAADNRSLEVEIFASQVEGVAGVVRIEALYIEHPTPEKLSLQLRSPAGALVDITASASLFGGALGMTGIDLEDFAGELARGTWTLIVTATDGAPAGNFSNLNLGFRENDRAIAFEYAQGPFPQAGRLLRATDALMQQLYRNEYDASGRITLQDDGRSETPPATIAYSEPAENGDLAATYTSPLGFKTAVVHDAGFRLKSIINPLGNRVAIERDDIGNVVRRTDALGGAVEFERGSQDRVTHFRDELGHETRFTYQSGTNFVTSITDQLGNVSTFEYPVGLAILGLATHNGEPVIQAASQGYSQVRTLIQNDYSKTEYYMDEKGRIGVVDTPGPKSDARATTANGATRRYDGAGRLTVSEDYDGRATTTEYTGASEVARVIDPDGKVEIFDHDHRGRVVQTTGKRVNVARYTYDGNGNILTFTDANGNVVTNEYDWDNRLVGITDARGGRTLYEYDALGQIIKTTDPIGRVRIIEYDAVGRAIAYKNGAGRLQVAMTYDARGRLTETRDGFGSLTAMEYDALGRVTRIVEPDGAYRLFEYDDRDRVVSSTDSTNRKIIATYNNHHGGFPESIEVQHWPADGVEPAGGAAQDRGLRMEFGYSYANDLTQVDDYQIEWEFDTNGQLSNIHNGAELGIDYRYDEAGRLSRANAQHANPPYPSEEYDREYSYDEAGNLVEVRASVRLANNFRSSTRRTYDALGRLVNFIDQNGDVQLYSYDANGNLASHTYPGGKTVAYEYDAADRLVKVADWAGRITTFAWTGDDRVARVDLPNGVSRRMDYNEIGQLVFREDRNGSGALILSYSYQYDQNGKLVSETGWPADAPPASSDIDYSYDSQWQRMTDANGAITRDQPGNVTAAPGIGALRYNARARMVSTAAYKYLYDQEDNLVGWQSRLNEAREVEFTVSPVGKLTRILSKRETDGSVSSESLYVYGVGLLYEEVDGQVRYFHPDYRGSTVALSNNAGTVIGRVDYDPYGRIARRTGETDTMFLFNGAFGCATSPEDLVNMRFRWYAPQLRQFLQRDPLMGDIGNPATLNYFAFAGGNPISNVDPEGEFWWLIGAAIGAVVNTAITFVQDLADDGQINTPAERYGAAALGGAVTGAIIAGTGGLGGAIAGGALGSATENLVHAGLTGEPVDPGALVIDAALGGAAGAAGYGAGKAVAKLGGKVFAKYSLSNNKFVSAAARQFKPEKLARRQGVRSLEELLIRSAKKTAGEIITRIVVSSGASIGGARIYDALTTQTQPLVGSHDGRKGLGASEVWVRYTRGGQPDKEQGRGIYRNYNLYLEMLLLSEQSLAPSPVYNLNAY